MPAILKCRNARVPSANRSLPRDFEIFQDWPATPLVAVSLDETQRVPIWCKLEYQNPSGSTKDRIARHILEKAWKNGEISEGSIVAEASSGSTSIAFAHACAHLGLKFVAFIPECASNERELIIRAYGGTVLRVPGGMADVIDTASQRCQVEGWFLGRQFSNLDNPEAHRQFTGHEILSQIPGVKVDAVVSGVGTGGTLKGLFQAFDEAGCSVKPFAAIPRAGELFSDCPECCSLVFSKHVPGVVEGLSEIYASWSDPSPSNIEVGEEECLERTRQLWTKGFPVGPSSGLNIAAALKVADQLGPDANVVTVFPDRMERYFSHEVFQPFCSQSTNNH